MRLAQAERFLNEAQALSPHPNLILSSKAEPVGGGEGLYCGI